MGDTGWGTAMFITSRTILLGVRMVLYPSEHWSDQHFMCRLTLLPLSSALLFAPNHTAPSPSSLLLPAALVERE